MTFTIYEVAAVAVVVLAIGMVWGYRGGRG